MLRLLYTSHAAPGLAPEQIREILVSAQRNNPALGLTGVLVSGGGLFMQVLEGPEQALLRQYVKILDDRRHQDCRLVYVSPASARAFPNWSMGMIDGPPMEFQHVMQLGVARRETVEPPAFAAVLRDFLQRLNAGK